MKNPHLLMKVLHESQRLIQTAIVDELFPIVKDEFHYALQTAKASPDLPTIVCLCGSTHFWQTFQEANFHETMAGRIVLSVGFYPHAPGQYEVTPEEKLALDALHKQKIDLADEILVLNVGGYIGDSTRSEIEHARKTGKLIRWLEPLK